MCPKFPQAFDSSTQRLTLPNYNYFPLHKRRISAKIFRSFINLIAVVNVLNILYTIGMYCLDQLDKLINYTIKSPIYLIFTRELRMI